MESSSDSNPEQQPQQEQQQELPRPSLPTHMERLWNRLDAEVARLRPEIEKSFTTYDKAVATATAARAARLSGRPEDLVVRDSAGNLLGQQGQAGKANNGGDGSNSGENSLVMSAVRAATLAMTKSVDTPRLLSPSGIADFSDEMRVAIAKLSMPLLTDPELIEAAIERADILTQTAREQPAGSSYAIDLRVCSLSFRAIAYGLRSSSMGDGHHDLGAEYMAAGHLREASRSLCDAMRSRNEHDIDGDQTGTREAAADTRELYGKVAEALADFWDARYIRLDGLGWGRVRCGGTECQTMLGMRTLASCRNCRSVFYCSRACQATDWKARHRPLCKAFVAEQHWLKKATSQMQSSATIDIPLPGVTNARLAPVPAVGSAQTLPSWGLAPQAPGPREWSGVEEVEGDLFDDIEKRERKRIKIRV